MKTKLIAFFSIALLILCTGCPYKATHRLTGNIINYDKDLIGKWKAETVEIRISEIDDQKFKYFYSDSDDDLGFDTHSGEGYTITNNGTAYIIAEVLYAATEQEKAQTKYITYRIEKMEKNTVTITPLEEAAALPYVKTFKTTADFTKFVTTNPAAFTNTDAKVFKRQ